MTDVRCLHYDGIVELVTISQSECYPRYRTSHTNQQLVTRTDLHRSVVSTVIGNILHRIMGKAGLARCVQNFRKQPIILFDKQCMHGRNDKRWRRRKPMMGDRLILSVPLPSVARRNAQAVITRTEWMAIVWHFVPGRSPCLCVVMVTSLSLCILRDQREESERKVLRKFPFA